MEVKKIGRRDLLRGTALLGAGLGASILSSCAPKVVEVTRVVTEKQVVKETVEVVTEKEVEKLVKETVVVEKEVPAISEGPVAVNMLVVGWMASMLGVLPATMKYNAANIDKAEVKMEETPTGWFTKVLAAVERGDPPWNGIWTMTQFRELRQAVESGLVQPVDDYIAASQNPYAARLRQEMIPSVWEGNLYEGKMYLLPSFVGRQVMAYRRDYLKEAGWDNPPVTWDEFRQCAMDLKKAFNDEIVPIGINNDITRGTTSAFYGMCKNQEEAFDSEGMMRISSDPYLEMVQMVKGWMDDGLTSFDVWASRTNTLDMWQKGKMGLLLEAVNQIPIAQKIWGMAQVDGDPIPVPKAGMPHRTLWTAAGPALFRNAAYPREAVDWMITMLAPEGDSSNLWFRSCLDNMALMSPYKAINERLVQGRDDMAWSLRCEQMVADSWPIPTTLHWSITEAKLPPWLDKVMSGEVGIEEAITRASEEIAEEFEKQEKL